MLIKFARNIWIEGMFAEVKVVNGCGICLIDICEVIKTNFPDMHTALNEATSYCSNCWGRGRTIRRRAVGSTHFVGYFWTIEKQGFFGDYHVFDAEGKLRFICKDFDYARHCLGKVIYD